jgi:uncharacterized protein (TIGR00303 family)
MMLRVHTQTSQGWAWLRRYWGQRPLLACVLGFTETGLLPGISAAGATPAARCTTAIADAEFLYRGPSAHPQYPLPPLTAGISPTFITRSVLVAQQIPLQLFNAGLPIPPPVPCVDLRGQPAQGVETGQAMDPAQVRSLFQQGLYWGQRLARQAAHQYVVLGECVVGGTTTALALLLGLGIPAAGKVNSSHPTCNHDQKLRVARAGLAQWQDQKHKAASAALDPLDVVAAIGDPMQVVVAGMVLTASRQGGVLLAGGTQMLAVYALARAIAAYHHILWYPEQVVVGTTRWVVEDATGDTVGLAQLIEEVPLISHPLSFANSRYPALQRYEQGYVKEGVAAGGMAIAATLYQNWCQAQLLHRIEALVARHQTFSPPPLCSPVATT